MHLLQKFYYSIAKRCYSILPQPIVTKRFGINWLLYASNWLDKRLLIGRPFEVEQLAFAEKTISDNHVETFFDCGANIGLYSLLLGHRAKSLQEIHAFEPVSHTWGRLVANVTLNKMLGKVRIHRFGLGNEKNSLPISVNEKQSGISTLSQKASDVANKTFTSSEMVEIERFDDHFTKNDGKVFFKIDLEGFEPEALEGMKQYLQNNHCILQVEVWPHNQVSIIELLENLQYKKFHQIEDDLYFRNFNPEQTT